MPSCTQCSMLRQVKDPGHPWMNRVCTRLPVFSSFISYGDHQHWRVPRHGNLGQCSLSLCPWALHWGCPELYSVEGSPQISFAAHRHVTIDHLQSTIYKLTSKYYETMRHALGSIWMFLAFWMLTTFQRKLSINVDIMLLNVWFEDQIESMNELSRFGINS